jgi:hypothetical protein
MEKMTKEEITEASLELLKVMFLEEGDTMGVSDFIRFFPIVGKYYKGDPADYKQICQFYSDSMQMVTARIGWVFSLRFRKLDGFNFKRLTEATEEMGLVRAELAKIFKTQHKEG